MAGVITLLDQPRTLNAQGKPTSAVVFFYETGTTVLADIFNDAALTDPAVNPILLASGEIFPDIYLDPDITYRRRIVYGDGTIHDVDPLPVGEVEVPWINVDDYGAVGNGIADDSSAITAAQNALIAQGGGELLFSLNKTYRVNTPITIARGVTYRGTGWSGIDLVNTRPGAKIISATSSLFRSNSGIINNFAFKNLFLQSEAGGGHCIEFSGPTAGDLVAKAIFRDLVFIQKNADKAVVYGTSVGGVFSLWFQNIDYQYEPVNTIEPMHFRSKTVNSITMKDFWSTMRTEVPGGKASILIESTNPSGHAFQNRIEGGVFELPVSGSVDFRSVSTSAIVNCTVYDLSVTPDRPQFRVAKGSLGPPSVYCELSNCRSTSGTSTNPDFYLDTSVGGQGPFKIDGCFGEYFTTNGVTPGVTVISSGFNNIVNASYIDLGSGVGNDIRFRTTSGTSRNWELWNGIPGNNDGHLNVSVNGSRVGGFSPSGNFFWGPAATNPNFYVDSSGEMRTKLPIYPPDGAGAFQSATSLIAGTGVPGAGLGVDGQFYFRSDGGGAGTTHLYFKNAGTWIGVA